MIQKDTQRLPGWLIVGIIWLVGAVSDRIWFVLDRSTPAWDQADYLTGTLNYWQALQQAQWLNSNWWTSFWLLSSKIPPLTYIAAAITQNFFGTGPDQATIVNLLFSAVLLGSVYGLGIQLFSVEVGLWAAALCQLLPSLYRSRLDFLLDYPLAAVVTLSFWCLTVWQLSGKKKARKSFISNPAPLVWQWLWAAAFGFCFGLAMLVKQTTLLFLLTPLVWVGVGAIRRQNWGRILQLIGALLLSVAVFAPWYRTNWLFVLTSGKRATIDAAIAEGDPALNNVAAWIYYWKILPYQVSWLLLLVPIVGLLIYWKKHQAKSAENSSSLIWLVIFWSGAYLLCSLNVNKDSRYVLPYLPVVSLFLAYGLTCWQGRWGNYLRWGTVGLAVMLMFLNLVSIAGLGSIAQILSPNAQHYAYLGSVLPHRQVIDEITQTNPYLRSTLGVLPSTPEINQHNFNYYGALKNFQVYGRQVGTREQQISQDARSLDWFLTKTGDQGSVPQSEADLVQIVERSPDFQLHKTWRLPDSSNLNLYHRRNPSVQVKRLEKQRQVTDRIALRVTVPKAPPGIPLPVTYEWSGTWQQLRSGLVLLTWRNQGGDRWLHDHGIGMGTLHSSSLQNQQHEQTFQVTEQLAMLPPSNIKPGIYTLEATYLNRDTGESYAIAIPPVTLNITPDIPAIPAPELDLVTQLRILAAQLPKGTDALGPVFDEVARINQYDPIQDYLVQTQLAMTYRLQQEANSEWAYTLALSRVLKRQVNDAIAAFEQVTKLDPQNPYAYAYLAFVHLYNWQPKAAQTALKPAFALNPHLTEIQALEGISALMQGNFIKAWHYAQPFLTKSKVKKSSLSVNLDTLLKKYA